MNYVDITADNDDVLILTATSLQTFKVNNDFTNMGAGMSNFINAAPQMLCALAAKDGITVATDDVLLNKYRLPDIPSNHASQCLQAAGNVGALPFCYFFNDNANVLLDEDENDDQTPSTLTYDATAGNFDLSTDFLTHVKKYMGKTDITEFSDYFCVSFTTGIIGSFNWGKEAGEAAKMTCMSDNNDNFFNQLPYDDDFSSLFYNTISAASGRSGSGQTIASAGLAPTTGLLGNSGYCAALSHGASTDANVITASNMWKLDTSFANKNGGVYTLDCNSVGFWAGLPAEYTNHTSETYYGAESVANAGDNFVNVANVDGAYWNLTTTNDSGICISSLTGTNATINNCCMNSSTVNAFVHCMNFASTANLKAANYNYVSAFWTSMNAASEADKESTCNGLLNYGLNWLDADQVQNWNVTCGNANLRSSLVTALETAKDDTTNAMKVSDFSTAFERYWGKDVKNSNGTADWFTTVSNNSYGNKMACASLKLSTTNTFDSCSDDTYYVNDFNALGRAQTALLNDATLNQFLAANETGPCNATPTNTGDAYNCCLNSQDGDEFSACVRTALGQGSNPTTAVTVWNTGLEGYQNAQMLYTLGSNTTTANSAPFATWAAMSADSVAVVGTLGFLAPMDFWEIQCLMGRDANWFTLQGKKLWDITQVSDANNVQDKSMMLTYRTMLGNQPNAFTHEYTATGENNRVQQCETLAGTAANCHKISVFDAEFGFTTFSANPADATGCPAAGVEQENRLPHCCSAEYNAKDCPVYNIDANWAISNGENAGASKFLTEITDHFGDFSGVSASLGRSTLGSDKTEQDQTKLDEMNLSGYLSQLPVPSHVLGSLYTSYFTDLLDEGVAFTKAAVGDEETGDNTGCNNSAAATANVDTWVDCMICSAQNNATVTSEADYEAADEYQNIMGCQGKIGEADNQPVVNPTQPGEQPTGGDGVGGDDDSQAVVCPDGCSASVLNVLGMSVIFAFIINMMN